MLFDLRSGVQLALILVASFMVVLDFTIVNIALPSMERDFGVATSVVQWVVTGYAIAFSGLLILGGRAADMLGRRRIFIVGLIVFSLASLAGGLAGDPVLLVASRIVQGAGAALVAPAALSLITDTAEALVKRLPPADLTSAQLRDRSWWSGSDLFLVVDDYDLVTGLTNPLQPLVDLIPQARDIGLHVVLARSAGGAGRAVFEPVLQRLREMGSPALIMSGNRDEGALFGVKPQSLPPGRGYLSSRRAEPVLMQVALAGAEPGPVAPDFAPDAATPGVPGSAGPVQGGNGVNPVPPVARRGTGRHSAPRS